MNESPYDPRKVRIFIALCALAAIVVCFGGWSAYKAFIAPAATVHSQNTPVPTLANGQVQPTAAGQQPIQPAPTLASNPGTVDNRPVITVGVDQFGSYFNVLQMAQDPSLPFRVEVVPFGFNDLIGNPNEETRGRTLYADGYNVLLMSDASLARMGNIGEVKFFIDQSWGVDQIVVKQIASNGQPIATFNDFRGKNICVANGNVNHFAVLAALRVARIDPTEVGWVLFDSVGKAVDGFNAGQCDIVGAWSPESDRAVKDGAGVVLFDSSQWNNIADVAVFSHKSLAEKPDLMYAFATAWMKYSKMQSEDLTGAGVQIARWTYNGENTNGWTFVTEGNANADMHTWLDTTAQAGLVENIVAMQNLGYFKLQMNAKRDAWNRAGMIVDVAPYNVDTIINSDFVMRMANDPSLINSGEFPNPNFQPLPADLPKAEASELLGLQTLVQLPCERFDFKPDSTQLSADGKAQVAACAEASRDMILSSQGQLLITGSSAWPAGYNEKAITDTATGRAASVYQEFIRMGVPADRIAILIVLPPVEHRSSFDEAVNSLYRYVRIEVKVSGR